MEDDEAFAEAAAQMLRRAGFEVTLAPDFRVALETLGGDGQIDLLLSDIVMPSSVNGIALSRMARLRRRDLKVLYVTGYNIPGLEDEALGPILRKPIEVESVGGRSKTAAGIDLGACQETSESTDTNRPKD